LNGDAMPVEMKPWWQSKTIAFNVASIAALFLASKGIPVEPELIAGVLLNLGSIVGRILARKKIAPVNVKGAW
jgi:hypothetical protein